jgi:glycine/D-amino acid oxidase-like deaminating enzyme
VKDYRSYSFWLDDCGDDLTPRAPLDGDADFDVVIVGGGYTGLWTAYYLAGADPALRIAVLEKEICGFGASGRNGGWSSAYFAGSRKRTLRLHGRDAAIALQRAMFDTVDEVGKVVKAEGIEADWHKGGVLDLATAPAHVERIRASVEHERAWGFGPEDYRWLDAEEAAARLKVEGLLGAMYSPHCARIQPANLVRGLARVVEGAGVKIFEQTPVTDIRPRRVDTERGRVTAGVVVRATESYTTLLPGMRRTITPVYSLMIATEPLPDDFWETVGWADNEALTDGRHVLIYAQRTAGNRIAMGGRGAPYHFGSRIEDSFDRDERVFAELERILKALMPASRNARITHRWGGPVGIPRDWYTSVGFDASTGIAWAGGYVGDGVSTTNLAGRTLTDLILERSTELTSLPWVNHRSRKWEPEPLRWIGTNLGFQIAMSADRREAKTGRRARRARLIDRLTGGH